MDFNQIKRDILSKDDKSRKGHIDIKIRQLVDAINFLDDYFTTSSCSGRIMVITRAKKKHEVKWLFASHEKVIIEDIKYLELPVEDTWFKQESMIIHISCRNPDAAEKLLKKTMEAGIRRCGIITLGKKIIVEIMGSDIIETIFSREGRMLFSNDYLQILLNEANSKMNKNQDIINKLCEKIKEL